MTTLTIHRTARWISLLVAGLAPNPLLAAPQAVAIQGGTVYPVSGPPIEGGSVLVEDGRIVAVGPMGQVDVAGATVIDATGKIVTPGLIEVGTQLGLVEVGSVASTRHSILNQGSNRSAFRVSDGIDPRSSLFPVLARDGITTALAAPSGGVIAGQGVALRTVGGDRQTVVFRDPVALYAALGPDATSGVGGSRAGPVMALRAVLDEVLEEQGDPSSGPGEAESGGGSGLGRLDDDVAPVAAVLNGEMPLVIRASGAADIEMALELQAQYGFDLVVDGGEEAWILADRLAAAGAAVVMRALENRPTQFHRLAARYDAPAILAEAGVEVIITTRSTHRAGQVTHEAGNAVRYGMSWGDALEAITLNPARIFGMADEVGSLEPGKLANLVVWSGDPLDFSGYAEQVWIQGELVDTKSRQERLFERYRRIPR